MQGTIFQSAQRIIAQVLEWLQTTTNTSIIERVSDTFQNGVCANDLNSMAIIGKDIDSTLLDFFHVEVQTGIAYISGERTALLDSPLLTYNAANPLNTTFDGVSQNVPTPQSTGSYNIPLTAGFVNYLFIGYLGTVDTTAFTLNDITLAKQFYKQTDGYQIVVNTTGINPNTAVYILLGQVNLSGTNQAVSSNISIVARPYYVSLLNRIGIQTNNSGRTDRPTTYAIGSNNYFLDDHIKSIGTGTVSPLNAHGISLVDLGINPNDTVEFHREHEHVRGIIAGTAANPDPQASAFFAQRVQVTPGDDFVIVQALGANEVAVLNGIAYTASEFGVNFTITFTGNPAGVYNIYFDGTTFGITQTDITNDDTKLWLATTTWTPTPGDGNLTLPADRRQFGTLNLLERWVTAGRPQDPQAGNFGYNFDINQLEYYDGTTWTRPFPSTGGTMSGPINMGSNKITGLANGTVSTDAMAFGQNQIIQWTSFSTVTAFSTNSNSFQTTNLKCSITPTSASNTILIMTTGPVVSTGSSANNAYVTIMKNGSNIDFSNGAQIINVNSPSTGQITVPCVGMWVNNPGSTSSVEYEVGLKTDGGIGSAQFGASNVGQFILLMEVAG